MYEFRVSSYCNYGACVEVAQAPNGSVIVRDGKDVEQASLVFTPAEWVAFIQGVKAGEFDLS